MAIRTKINTSNFANESSIRIDFNYVNYLNNTDINSKLSKFILAKENQATDPPEEFKYVEIGDLNSKGKISPNKVNLNIRNFDTKFINKFMIKIKKLKMAIFNQLKLMIFLFHQ